MEPWVGWSRFDRSTSLTSGLPSRWTWLYIRAVPGPVLLLSLHAVAARLTAATIVARAGERLDSGRRAEHGAEATSHGGCHVGHHVFHRAWDRRGQRTAHLDLLARAFAGEGHLDDLVLLRVPIGVDLELVEQVGV